MPRKAASLEVKMAFEEAKVRVAIANILPLKITPDDIKKTSKYAQIAASIREVGLVEPPVIARDQSDPAKYLLLDGHLRIEVLKDLGQTDVACLVATDDEAYTYNKRVNRIAMVQRHGARCTQRSAERRRETPERKGVSLAEAVHHHERTNQRVTPNERAGRAQRPAVHQSFRPG